MTLSSIPSRRLSVLSTGTAGLMFALSVLLSGLAALTPSANAQTVKTSGEARVMHDGLRPIAPFISKDTLLAVRFDVDRIDYDVFNQSLKQAFDQFLTNLQFDDAGVQACQKEFSVAADVLTEDLKKEIADFKDKTGLADVYYIVQTTRGEGACFIAPVDNITQEQQEECKKLAEKFHLNCALYQQKFMVATREPLKDFGAYYKDFKASPNKTLDSAIAKNGDKVVSWYCGRLKIRPLFHATQEEGATSARVRQYDPFSNSPRSVKDLVEVFDASFVEGSGYVNVSTLSVHYTLKFTTSINAGKFHDGLVDVVDAYNAFYFQTLEKSPRQVDLNEFGPGKQLTAMREQFVKQYNLFGIVKEFVAGSFQSLMPTQDEELITFDDSLSAEVEKLGPRTLGLLALGFNLFNENSEVEFEEMESAVIEFDSNNVTPQDNAIASPFKRVD